jgi:predicted O-methyltransferase YrrM
VRTAAAPLLGSDRGTATGLRAHLRDAVARAARTGTGQRLLAAALSDEATLAEVLNRLSDRMAAEAHADALLPRELERVRGFEDLAWLFTPGVLVHGLARLTVGEAAYLYRLVHSLDAPRVVELGRYHGGSTLLLAAAGCELLSLDVDPARDRADERIRRVLARLCLADRVELAVADSQVYPVEPRAYDVVFVDADHTYEGVRADVEHWWPGLRPGGHLLLHDGQELLPARPWNRVWKTEGVRRCARELLERPDVHAVRAPDTLVHLICPEAAPTL